MAGEAPAIGVLASGSGTNLQALIDASERSELRARVALVISNNSDAGALVRARRHAIPWRHLSSRGHPDPAVLDQAIRDALLAHGADLVVLAGYMKLLGAATLSAFAGRILNIHPALLPAFGGPGMYGPRVHEAVLAAGARISGVSAHLVTARYDRGPVILQKAVSVEPGDTPQALGARILKVEHRLLPEAVRRTLDALGYAL